MDHFGVFFDKCYYQRKRKTFYDLEFSLLTTFMSRLCNTDEIFRYGKQEIGDFYVFVGWSKLGKKNLIRVTTLTLFGFWTKSYKSELLPLADQTMYIIYYSPVEN